MWIRNSYSRYGINGHWIAQPDRLEVGCGEWRTGEESRGNSHGVLSGDSAGHVVWCQLDGLLTSTWPGGRTQFEDHPMLHRFGRTPHRGCLSPREIAPGSRRARDREPGRNRAPHRLCAFTSAPRASWFPGACGAVLVESDWGGSGAGMLGSQQKLGPAQQFDGKVVPTAGHP